MPGSNWPHGTPARCAQVFLMWLVLAPFARAATPSADIPVKLCNNVWNGEGGAVGIDEEGRFAHEEAHTVSSSARNFRELAFFTNGRDGAVAPAAWTCESEVGVDGSTVLRVHPPKGEGNKEPVILVETSGGGCVGCALGMACGYFPAARRLAVEWSMDIACSQGAASGQARREARRQLSRHHVRFEKRSVKREAGDSGGSLSVIGIVAFDHSVDVYSARLTCRMDASKQGVCEIAAKTFAAEYPPPQ